MEALQNQAVNDSGRENTSRFLNALYAYAAVKLRDYARTDINNRPMNGGLGGSTGRNPLVRKLYASPRQYAEIVENIATKFESESIAVSKQYPAVQGDQRRRYASLRLPHSALNLNIANAVSMAF